MAEIQNTEYITIKRDDKGQVGVFVGEKSATTYRGKTIAWVNFIREDFADIQKLNPEVAELHVLSSETCGKFGEFGSPSAKHGPNAWCRVRFKDGQTASWVFYYTYDSAAGCANGCANDCVIYVRGKALFRSAVFGAPVVQTRATSVATPIVAPATKISEGTRAYEVGDYKITVIVEKIKQNIK